MATLRELEALVHAAIRQDLSVDSAAAELGCDPARLAIYRRFIAGHVRTALDKNFPVLAALLGPERWAALGEAFYAERPPSHWELNEAARPFPGWLAAHEEAGHEGLLPFHVALASWEWEEFATYVHPAEIPTPDELTQPAVNPTLSILESPCPVARFMSRWLAGDREAPLPTPADGPEVAFLWRRPDTARVAFHQAVDDLVFAVTVAHQGLDPAAAARAHGLPEDAAVAAFERAVAMGLVLRPDLR